jgi:hypothetical protein
VIRALAIAALLLAVSAVPALTQQRGSVLDRVEERVQAHAYSEAREALGRWWEQAGDTVRGDNRARGLFLRAVLGEDLAAVERDLLQVAVEHPQSAVADRALLRLGQLRLAQGDSAGSEVFLERLLQDHPQSGERARALAILGRTDAPAARAAAPRQSRTAAAAPVPAPASTRAAAPAPRAAPAAEYRPGVDFTAQVGSFATIAEAEALRDRLRGAGFDAFLARVGGSPRTLVRVGTFRERAAADALVRRLRAAGYTAEAVAINLP